MIFNKGGHKFRTYHFFYKQNEIEIAQNYCYLGIEFTAAGNFNLALTRLKEKANKVLFSLRYFNSHGDIDMTFKLFQSLIVPIATYAGEVWAPYLINSLNEDNFMQLCDRVPTEQVHVKLCRFLLGVHRKSSIAAVKGELGSYPLLITSLCSATKYWHQLHKCDPNSLIFHCLQDNYMQIESKNTCWLTGIKKLMCKFDLNNYWENVRDTTIEPCVKTLSEKLCSEYTRLWAKFINGDGRDSNKLRTYCTFKNPNFRREKYLDLSIPIYKRKNFSKLRISAHDLQIEKGRYNKTPLERRLCNFCTHAVVEDEVHFMLECELYAAERQILLASLEPHNINYLSVHEKFIFLMSGNNGDHFIIKQVLRFVNSAMEVRQHRQSCRR